jgi:hypothetical protein
MHNLLTVMVNDYADFGDYGDFNDYCDNDDLTDSAYYGDTAETIPSL